MHDWTLERLTVDWKSGEAHAFVRSPKGSEQIRASGLREIRVPKHEEWGPSVSINSVDGPNRSEDGLFHLDIEMQSGDRIKIVAKSITMPSTELDIPIGKIGKILAGKELGRYVKIVDDEADTGGYLILTWNNPDTGEGFDDWVENRANLVSYIRECGWLIEWLD